MKQYFRGRRACTGILLLLLTICCFSCKPPQASYEQIVSLFHRGEFSRAIELSERETKRFKAESDTDRECEFRLLEADALLSRGRQGDADHARELLSARLQGGQDAGRLGVIRRRLTAYYHLQFQNDLRAAEILLNEAQQSASSLSLRNELAAVENLQGRLLGTNRMFELAEKKTRSARQLAIESGDRYQEATALSNLGMFHIQQSRFDEAIVFLQEAHDIAAREGALPLMQGCLLNLGICYSFLGDFDEALARIEQGRKLLNDSETVGKSAYFLGALGNTWMLQREPGKAIPLYREALAKANNDSARATWARNLASAFIEDRNWDAATDTNAEALRLDNDPTSAIYATLNAAKIASGRGTYKEGIALFEQCIATSSNHPGELWEAHAGLAGIYKRIGDRKSANRHFEKALTQITATLESVPDEKRITYFSRLINFYQDYVRALVEQGRSDKALSVAESSRARILTARLGIRGVPGASFGIPDYQRVARLSKATVLSYWLAPSGSFLWVVTPTKVHLFRLVPAASEIEGWVRAYSGEITGLRDAMITESLAGRRLFETLVAPAMSLIPQGSPVIIVPDGALHFLNFETLPVYDQKNRHYWLEDVTLSVAPSLDVFALRTPAKKTNAESMLIIGDSEPVPEFPKLAYAGVEIEKILGHYPLPQNEVITGHAADPAAYPRADPGRFSMIHFSAHAEANQQHPLESFIVLSRKDENFKLYAREVKDIPLRADLVTISACRGAGARSYSGEGLVGFVWAFMHAGARSVIAGLWAVTDDVTPKIMDTLYGEIEAGRTPAQALRSAKLAMVRKAGAAHKPYYWGPFQVYVR